MSPTPFRRAAAVVALSFLALGAGSLGAQAVTETPTVAACTGTVTGPTYTSLDDPTIEKTLTNGTAAIVDGGVAISATNGHVAFTDYGITPFALSAAGSPSLDYTATSGQLPGLTMSFSLEGAWAGTLVHEPDVYGADQWWSTRPVGGFERAELFTLNELLAQEPDAMIMGVGFSLGSGATGAGTVHGFTVGCTTYAFDVTATPTPTPTPTATPTVAPTSTPAPSASPTPGAVPVPALDIVQPTCNGTTVVPNGSIGISPASTVVWAVVVAGSDGESDEDYIAESEEGEARVVAVAPGTYEVWALTVDGEFGDLGDWQADDYFIYRTVTINAFTGPCPAVTSWTPSADQLTAANQGGFTAPARVNQGGAVTLGGLPAGARVRTFLFSVPTDLGAATVAADGTLKVTIPAGTTVGTHRIAVYQADGTLIGWRSVEVVAAGQQLAVTGVDPRAGILAGAVLVVAGGALVVARRRLAS
ncbi:hypothetical protein [Cellulomonas xiejunii]|uniref:Uncharacterized protein n=1 Tax=Cellulomonas xiejunii TaxID=2968083 RepID=A0ABY5KRT3_9CELL|nr:hypothetical protein [Cellulomonas xiejunii]MCC2322410.1 hypothetical protein [Cellulomonas xiejunii]UUI72459.1 hypothetical protein NP048_03035 [Cellulomonas xiejunii]